MSEKGGVELGEEESRGRGKIGKQEVGRRRKGNTLCPAGKNELYLGKGEEGQVGEPHLQVPIGSAT